MRLVREYWTETRRGLVIEGNPDTIRFIAGALNLPAGVTVQVSNSRSVIGLWGEFVRAYQELPVSLTRSVGPQHFVLAD
jgi:hypothetical protein